MKKRLLICLAHPDDESFGMGGTIAYYANQGVEIRLICATRGESGTVDAEHLRGFKNIAELRESELSCAASVLGIEKVVYLDYRDSGMKGSKDNGNKSAFINAAEEEVAGKIVKEIRSFKPHVIITFDSTGGYHHPDHIAIHKASIQAFHAAGEAERFPKAGKAFSPEILYFFARSRKKLRRLVTVMRLTGRDPKRVGRNKDIDLTVFAKESDTPSHVSINYAAHRMQKTQADKCHASQYGEHGLSIASLIRVLLPFLGKKDHFTRAHPPASDNYRSTDLFKI
jgi:LmbE family N-acetylglucosaminyl deacetylase